MSREIDLLIDSFQQEEIVLVELKGYSGNSYINLGTSEEKGTLRYFFRSTVPLAQKYYKDTFSTNPLFKALFITTGNYHSQAEEFITKMNQSVLKPSRFPKTIWNGTEIVTFLNDNGFKHQAKIIKKFYVDYDPKANFED